jgi:calcineurin-like phosphoesterase family protein
MTTWFTADTHFGHAKLIAPSAADASHGGRSFSSVEEMDETLIENWNALVRPSDKINVLGDFFVGDYDTLPTLFSRLNGKKRLVIGNHDKFLDYRLLAGFEKVLFWRKYQDHSLTCTHLPQHESDFTSKYALNVHGHIHEQPDPSSRHLNVGVDRWCWKPVSLDDIKTIIALRGLA